MQKFLTKLSFLLFTMSLFGCNVNVSSNSISTGEKVNKFLSEDPSSSAITAFIEKEKISELPKAELKKMQMENDLTNVHLSGDEFWLQVDKKNIDRSIEITVNNNLKYSSETLSICSSLSEKFKCVGVFADDTLHLDEMSTKYIIFSSKDTLKLFIKAPYSVEDIVEGPYAVEPNLEGYKDMNKLKILDDNLDVSSLEPNKELILFIILKDKEDNLFKKLVWHIKKSS